MVKQYVLRRHLKESTCGWLLTVLRRTFQTVGPRMENALSLSIVSVRGMI